MLLKEIMTREVQTVGTGATLEEAAKKMKETDIGFLPITEGDRLVGLVTDRDIVLRAVADGLDPQTSVKDIETNDVVYCFEDQDVQEAAKLMGDRQIRRIVVVNRQRHPVGVISLGDLANELQRTDNTAKQVLEKVSKPGQYKGR